MKYTSFLRYITTSSWMISPNMARMAFPILNGTLLGLDFTEETPLLTTYQNVDQKNRDAQIAVHYLNGLMLKHDQECGPIGTMTVAKQIIKDDANVDIIGHIILIDSGGGAANSVPVLADAITGANKPVVALIEGTAASAAIYAASFCDYIFSDGDMNMVGCVGTMIEFAQFPTRTQMQDGAILVRLYADQSSEKNEEYEQAINGNVQIIKDNLLNPIAEKFISDMKKNRPAVPEEQLKGRTYFAKDVIGSFIDEIGKMQDAIGKVIELANNQEGEISSQQQQNMYENLEKIPSCTGLQVQDGGAFLNQEQLAEVDAALSNGETQENDNLGETVNQQREEIKVKDARITELEEALAKLASPAATTTANVTEQGSENTEDERTYCENLYKELNNY